MRISELIKTVEGAVLEGCADADVRGIVYRSADVKSGFCFVAIAGRKSDGHLFVDDAIKRGASAIVSERGVNAPEGVVNVIVNNPRSAMAAMSAAFYGDPSKDMTLVGVTGTNGKTTITYLLEAMLKAAGRKVGVVGTIDYRFDGFSEKAKHTTPESADLQALFRRMRDADVDACAMEVSSHSLSQGRVARCRFDAAAFTNLTPEHLDYHDGMEDYFAAKAILFERLLAEGGKKGAFAVINGDDPYGKRLFDKCPVTSIGYGLGGEHDVVGRYLQFDAHGLRMCVETPSGGFECRSRLCGRFNAQNILAATAVAARLGVDLRNVSRAIESMDVVPGRFESVENGNGVLALVDYAHTPDALENVLAHARELAKDGRGRLIAVFGCGGDRDRDKRPLMGEVAAKIADIILVTSDNPRTERPESIIDDILPGLKRSSHPMKDGSGYEIIVDRRDAIARAVALAKEGDVLVVAGKGHEDYQILGSKTIHFDDREVLRELLQG